MKNTFIAYSASVESQSCYRCHWSSCSHSNEAKASYFKCRDELTDDELVKIWAEHIKLKVDQIHIYRNGVKVFDEYGFPWSYEFSYFWDVSEEEFLLRTKYKKDIEKLYSKVLELSKE